MPMMLMGVMVAFIQTLVFTLLTIPVVIVTGYLEWQNRYKGIKSKIFFFKIAIFGTSMISTSTVRSINTHD